MNSNISPMGAHDEQARAAVLQEFLTKGLPHRGIEEFKYTDLRNFVRAIPAFAETLSSDKKQALSESGQAFTSFNTLPVTFINGIYSPDNGRSKLPEGVSIQSLSSFIEGDKTGLMNQLNAVRGLAENKLYELNTQVAVSGVVLHIAKGVHVQTPLHLRFITGDQALFSADRCVIVVEEGASVTLLESHEGQGDAAHFINDVLGIQLKKQAKISHIRLNRQNIASTVLSTCACILGEESDLKTWSIVSGGKLNRHQVFCEYQGKNAVAQINGVQMVRGEQLTDTTLQMDHAQPGGISRELFKTAIDDRGVGVFQGKIIVEPYAQKTDGKMMSASLLLSEGATMNNKPELEIYADDVVCAHGATCGQLDDDLLFYLMARGLPRKDAESLVIQAFLNEAVEDIAHEGVVSELEAIIEEWLKTRSQT